MCNGLIFAVVTRSLLGELDVECDVFGLQQGHLFLHLPELILGPFQANFEANTPGLLDLASRVLLLVGVFPFLPLLLGLAQLLLHMFDLPGVYAQLDLVLHVLLDELFHGGLGLPGARLLVALELPDLFLQGRDLGRPAR